MRKTLVTLVVSIGCTLSAQASVIQIFYTQNASPDVFSSTYNTTTNTLGASPLPIGSNPSGGDGIIIGPANTLIYGDETGGGGVFQITQTLPDTPPFPVFGTGTANSFDVATNQNNPTTVFNFNNAGQIATLPIVANVITNGTLHTVTGADTNVSDLFWSSTNQAYYLTGSTGTTGDLGLINLSTFVTSAPLFAGIPTAQEAYFDPFTGLIVLFGDGQVDTYNPTTNTLGTAVVLPGATAGTTCVGGAPQIDLGAVDGAGHAYVAACGVLSYIDYSGTGNILSLADVRQSVVVPGGIKDVTVLPVPSVGTPEPASFALIGFGLLGFAFRLRRKA